MGLRVDDGENTAAIIDFSPIMTDNESTSVVVDIM